MKKIFGFIFALIMSVSFANAQITTENASFFDNWFVGLNLGAVAPQDHSFDFANHSWLGDYHNEVGIELGKWITPVVGLGVSYEAQGNVNRSKTLFDMGLTTADVHFNLTNLFAGYNGTPRAFEVEFIPSVGFTQYYGDVYPAPHKFYVAGRAALSANYNFGSDRQWAVYLRPAIEYVDRPRHYNGLFDVRVGLTYKFKGSKSKSHNFVVCPYSVTQADYDDMVVAYNNLKHQEPQVKEVVTEVVRNIEVKPADNVRNVHFAFNQTALTDTEKTVLNDISSGSTVDIDAYASKHGGSDTVNKIVSDKRAQAVKEYLEGRGVKVNECRSHGAVDEYTEQVAVVTIK